MRTGTPEHARARRLVITGIAVMAIGVAMSVWETHAEHALVLQAAQGTPSIEGLSVVEITERGWKRGEVVISANSAMLSGKVLKAMMAGGDEEHTRFVEAARTGDAQTTDEQIEQIDAYIDALYERGGRNWMEVSQTAGRMVVLFGLAIIIIAVVGERISERYGKNERSTVWLREAARTEKGGAKSTPREVRAGATQQIATKQTRMSATPPIQVIARGARRGTVRNRCDESR